MGLWITGHFSVRTAQRFVRELNKKEKKETYLAASGLCFSAREIILSVITLGIYAVYRALESTNKVKEAVSFVDEILSLNKEVIAPSDQSPSFPSVKFSLKGEDEEDNHPVELSQVVDDSENPLVQIKIGEGDKEEREILFQGTLLELQKKILADAIEHEELHKRLGGKFKVDTTTVEADASLLASSPTSEEGVSSNIEGEAYELPPDPFPIPEGANRSEKASDEKFKEIENMFRDLLLKSSRGGAPVSAVFDKICSDNFYEIVPSKNVECIPADYPVISGREGQIMWFTMKPYMNSSTDEITLVLGTDVNGTPMLYIRLNHAEPELVPHVHTIENFRQMVLENYPPAQNRP